MLAVMRGLLVLGLVFAMCSCSRHRSSSVPAPSTPLASSPTTRASERAYALLPPLAVTSAPLSTRTTGEASVRGAPHQGFVEAIELAIDSRAALTLGGLGELRLWTALDGRVEPVPVPFIGARDLALARHASGWRVGVIDGSGAARLWHYAPKAGFAQLFATSPHRQFATIDLLPGGTRAVVLGRDHALSLIDDRGAIVDTLEQRGVRPVHVHVSADGRQLRTLSVQQQPVAKPGSAAARDQADDETTGAMTFSVTIGRVSIADGKRKALALAGQTSRVTLRDIVGPPRFAMSPNGERAAYLAPVIEEPSMVDVFAIDTATGATRPLVSRLLVGTHQHVGFVDERTLYVIGHPEGRAWMLDVAATSPPAQNVHARAMATSGQTVATPQAFGHGVHVSGFENWIYVRDSATGIGQYLGYRPFQPIAMAFSPSGNSLLWIASGSTAYVETVAQPGARLSRFIGTGAQRIVDGVFVGERHVLLLDRAGQIILIEHGTGAVIAAADVGGNSGTALEYSREHKLVRVERGALDVWLYEVDVSNPPEQIFRGPYVLRTADQTASGLLDGTSGDALWTLDSAMVYRTYSMTDIRSTMSHAAMLDRGTTLTPPPTTAGPMAIDRRGVRYHVADNRVAIYEGSQLTRTIDFGTSGIVRIVPAPTGSLFAAVTNRSVVQIYERASGARLWSYAVPHALTDIAWSADSALIAIASTAGAVTVDVATGVAQHRVCGLWFEARSSAPVDLSVVVRNQNLCTQ